MPSEPCPYKTASGAPCRCRERGVDDDLGGHYDCVGAPGATGATGPASDGRMSLSEIRRRVNEVLDKAVADGLMSKEYRERITCSVLVGDPDDVRAYVKIIGGGR